MVPTTIDILASLSSFDIRKCAYSLGINYLKTQAAGVVAFLRPPHCHHHPNLPT
jgi:hypothetical protein